MDANAIDLPCLDVTFVPTEKVVANEYNPNEVAREEMDLLEKSIEKDGFTQPLVAYHDDAAGEYIVVDGFHRFVILRDRFGCSHVPLVVLDRPLDERMASTVRHNRARGKHQVDLTEQLVSDLVEAGWSNERIAKHLGMRAEEVLRLQQEKGIAEFYAHRSHSKAWRWRLRDGEPAGGKGDRLYMNETVLEAARERVAFAFDEFETIVMSVSGGKDSQVMFELAYEEAERRGQEVHAFFLDQEAEYASTIEVVEGIMDRDLVVPHWYQIPIYMTNATSYEQEFLYAWGPQEDWMRDKHPLAIHDLDADYPQRFYPFIDWFEGQWDEDTCFLVGLRAEESLNRLRAVIKNPGIDDVLWSTAGDEVLKLYPLYDWSFSDIFQYFYDHDVDYNRVYDYMHAKDEGHNVTQYRVSNLIHEKAYTSLTELQEFEHETYEALIERLEGITAAARYAGDPSVYNARQLPEQFDSWKAYRDHLLETAPIERKERFLSRFKNHHENEHTYRQQARQLLLNDWENNLPVQSRSRSDSQGWKEKWKEIL